MSIVLPVHGQLLWDVPLDTALHNLASMGFGPNEHGWMNWTSDPSFCQNSDGQTSGTVRMIKLPNLPKSYTVTSIKYFIAGAAVTPVAGQNFAGLYDAAGTRVAVTADIGASTTTVGMKTFTLTAPYVVTANAPIWAALLTNAATPLSGVAPAAVAGRDTLFNGDLTAATARYTSGPVAQTTLPASITMASRTLLVRSPWVAVA